MTSSIILLEQTLRLNQVNQEKDLYFSHLFQFQEIGYDKTLDIVVEFSNVFEALSIEAAQLQAQIDHFNSKKLHDNEVEAFENDLNVSRDLHESEVKAFETDVTFSKVLDTLEHENVSYKVLDDIDAASAEKFCPDLTPNPNSKVILNKNIGVKFAVDEKGKNVVVPANQPVFEEINFHSQHTSNNCIICFETCKFGIPDTIGTSTNLASQLPGLRLNICKHVYCHTCLKTYILSKIKTSSTSQINCADVACKREISLPELSEYNLLDEESMGVLERRQVEGMMLNKMNCPNSKCSSVMEKPDVCTEDDPIPCPACTSLICVSCMVLNHVGFTCEAFQKLPLENRCVEDVQLYSLAKQKGWEKCPECSFMVEKTDGCNHVKCRCGCDFCFKCCTKYKNTIPGAGEPACKCSLFDVPEENQLGAPLMRQMEGLRIADNNPAPFENPLNAVVLRRMVEPNYDIRRIEQYNHYQSDDETDDEPAGHDRHPGLIGIDGSRKNYPNWLKKYLSENTCHYCERQFNSLLALDQHLSFTKAHEVYSCCGRTFKSQHGLDQHDNQVHIADNDYNPNYDIRGIEQYNHYQSDDETDDEPAGHDRHPGLIGIDGSRKDYPNWLKKYLSENTCHYCERQFNSLLALDQHLSFTKAHEVYSCCGRTFKSQHGLDQHDNQVHY